MRGFETAAPLVTSYKRGVLDARPIKRSTRGWRCRVPIGYDRGALGARPIRWLWGR